MSLNVLLLTDEDDFESALPTLNSFAHATRRAPLSVDAGGDTDDVAIIDARTDLSAARRACHRVTANVPAIAVVAVVAPADFVAVDVDWGFDDVLLPAAGGDELRTRLRLAVTRRRNTLAGILKFGDLTLYPERLSGSVGGKDLGLTRTEFKLLSFLVQQAGRAFTRTRLMQAVWGYECTGRVRTVDVHVRRLRAKLGPEYDAMVDTVRGVGYMAVTPPQPQWIVAKPTLTPMHIRDDAGRAEPITR